MGLGLRRNHGEFGIPEKDCAAMDAQRSAERTARVAREESRAALEARAAVCGLEAELLHGLSKGLLGELAAAGAGALDRPELAARVRDELADAFE